LPNNPLNPGGRSPFDLSNPSSNLSNWTNGATGGKRRISIFYPWKLYFGPNLARNVPINWKPQLIETKETRNE
jgi:hypothetical protein